MVSPAAPVRPSMSETLAGEADRVAELAIKAAAKKAAIARSAANAETIAASVAEEIERQAAELSYEELSEAELGDVLGHLEASITDLEQARVSLV